MPVCPNCEKKFSHRKNIDGIMSCPNCKTPVVIYDGEWHKERRNAPSTEILDHFAEQFKKRYGAPISFAGKEVILARVQANRLLDRAVGNKELTKEAITIQFTHPKFVWADRFNLGRCAHDFSAALAFAAKKLVGERHEDEENDKYIEQLGREEDVFA